MATIDFLFSDYVRGVRCSAQSAAVLNARLHKVAPPDMTPEQKRALRFMDGRADEVAEVTTLRERMSVTKLRPVIATHTNGFSALYEGLVATSRVPLDVSDRGERAQALLNTLFVDALSFTQLDAESAWAEGARRLERIEEEGLREEIEDLVGKDLLATAKKASAKLADAIGTGQSRPVPSTTALQDALTRFGRAVGAYGRAMAASVDEDDEAAVARFLKAMAPIDMHRASQVSRGGGTEETDETGAPVITGSPSVVGTPSPSVVGTPSPSVVGAPSPTTLVGAPSPRAVVVPHPVPQPADPADPVAA